MSTKRFDIKNIFQNWGFFLWLWLVHWPCFNKGFYHLEPVIKSEIFTFELVLWLHFKDHNLDRSSMQIGFSKTFDFQPQISLSASYAIWVQVSSALIYIYFWAQNQFLFPYHFSSVTSIPNFISLFAFIVFFIHDTFIYKSFHHCLSQYSFAFTFHFISQDVSITDLFHLLLPIRFHSTHCLYRIFHLFHSHHCRIWWHLLSPTLRKFTFTMLSSHKIHISKAQLS